jgi:hypothetical protein
MVRHPCLLINIFSNLVSRTIDQHLPSQQAYRWRDEYMGRSWGIELRNKSRSGAITAAKEKKSILDQLIVDSHPVQKKKSILVAVSQRARGIKKG